MLHLSVGPLVKVDNIIWFTTLNFNGLFKFDIDTLQIEFVYRFKFAKGLQERMYTGKIIYYNDELFFFPYYYNRIVSYNIVTKTEKIILIADFIPERLGVNTVIQKGTEVFFRSDVCLDFYVLDLVSKKVKKMDDIFPDIPKEQGGWSSLCEDRLLIVLADRNSFIEITNNSKKYFKLPNYFNEWHLNRVYYDGELYWLLFGDNIDIYSWSAKTQEIERYKGDDSLEKNILGYYLYFFSFENEICILGNNYCGVFKINQVLKKIENLFQLPDDFKIINNILDYTPFKEYEIIDKKLWLFPRSGNQLVIYDKEKNQVRGIEFSVEQQNIPDWSSLMIDRYITNKEYITEGMFTLEDYIYLLKNIDSLTLC